VLAPARPASAAQDALRQLAWRLDSPALQSRVSLELQARRPSAAHWDSKFPLAGKA